VAEKELSGYGFNDTPRSIAASSIPMHNGLAIHGFGTKLLEQETILYDLQSGSLMKLAQTFTTTQKQMSTSCSMISVDSYPASFSLSRMQLARQH
jgi:hypothetical protein